MSIQEKINAKRANRALEPETPERAELRDKYKSVDASDESTRGADEEFLRRFQISLNRRSPLPPKNPKDTVALTPKAPVASAVGAPKDLAPSTNGLPAEGSILAFANRDVAIFHRDVPAKNYQVILLLHSDGSISPEGVNLLSSTDFRKIGQLPTAHIGQLLNTLTWDRDHIVFHLDDYRHVNLIPKRDSSVAPETRSRPEPVREAEWPAPKPQAPAPLPAEEQRRLKNLLVRGRRFRIIHGRGREWEAVYWCEDEKGSVVAHKTQGVWSLMHLDLKRFKDNMVLLDAVSDEEEIEIEKALRKV